MVEVIGLTGVPKPGACRRLAFSLVWTANKFANER